MDIGRPAVVRLAVFLSHQKNISILQCLKQLPEAFLYPNEDYSHHVLFLVSEPRSTPLHPCSSSDLSGLPCAGLPGWGDFKQEVRTL